MALTGSLIIGGGIYFAVKSTEHVKKGLADEKTVTEQTETERVINSSFRLPDNAGRFPALLVKQNNEDERSVPLKISSVKVDVKVAGNLATTLYDITYCNSLPRILDGQFCFPLGEGQTISYFAMEIDGQLREASIVEKSKGRKTYEAVVRRKIDPALLEWTAGNNFKTRIYPIPANGCKRVIVGFEQELLNKSNATVYYQPISFPNVPDNFTVHAEVLNQELKPTKFDEQGLPVKFKRDSNKWIYDDNIRYYVTGKSIAFQIPKNDGSRNVMVEKAKNGDATFYLNVIPEKYSAKKSLPSAICVLWDVSASAEKRNLNSEKQLLFSYLKKINNTKVELVTFSNDIHTTEVFNITNGQTAELEKRIDKLVYDGGTQLGKLDLTSYNCDEFILVTDGISNFGEENINLSRTPLNVFCSSPISDYSYLKGLTQSTGGKFLNLQTTDSATCINELSTLEYHFISCEASESISDIYPSTPTTVIKNFTLAGKLHDNKGELKLNFGIGNKILYSEEITVYNDQVDYEGMVNRAWAQKKLNELDIFHKRNKEEITSLGKKYNIVTRNTSLLVLDRIEDYLEHRVVPKDPDLKQLYLTRVREIKLDADKKRKEHVEWVVKDFQDMRDWYNTEYKIETEEKINSGFTVNLDSTVAIGGTYLYSFSNNEVSKDAEVVENNNNSLTYTTLSSGASTTLSNITVTDANACTFGWSATPEKDNSSEFKADIQLNGWDPQTPYIRVLKSVPAAQAYSKYISIKKIYAAQPSFFVDVADYFIKLKETESAIRILSNIAELELENHQLLRVLAHRLQQLNENKLAICTYRKILEIRDEEPQSYRDLGLAYADDKQYQKAVDYLCKVVNRVWDSRFPQVECLAVAEINHVLAKSKENLNLDSLDKRLTKAMPCDVRIVINWDTDNCDMDLWVTDPDGDKCFYNEPLTNRGGLLSRDFTGGYGPEVFMIRKATKGKYLVQVNYYGTSSQGLTGPTTVQAELYTNWGRPNEVRKTVTLRLADQAEVIDIGNLAFVSR